ncbi:MAG: hypothetical protein QM749_09890 [Aquabacterium sp.]
METQYIDDVEQADRQQPSLARKTEPQTPPTWQSMGLIVFGSTAHEPHELKAWGRTLSIFKEKDQTEYLVPDYHTPDHKKRHIKFIRKTSRYMAELFGDEGSLLCVENAGYKVRSPISEDVLKMVSAEVRSEVYMPLVFSRRTELLGGIYAYIWRCCTNAQMEATATRPLSTHPVNSLVTGMCMFGSNIYGVDQYGEQHPLTNTFYTMPRGRKILSVALTDDELHPYEHMMLQQFRLQMPMFKAMGGQAPQKVFYQSVFEEYVLYGVNLFLRGEMSIAALKAYAHHVRRRTDFIKARIAEVCLAYGVDWDHGQSTLSALFCGADKDEARQQDPVDAFLCLAGISPTLIVSDLPVGERVALIRQTCQACVRRLAAQSGALGEVWSHVADTLRHDDEQHNTRYSEDSLLTLNFLNYAAKVAFVRRTQAGEVCLSHPFHEKAMALSYKDMHAEKFGEILAINWIPPLFSHGSFKDGLYYLDEDRSLLNGLIERGVLDQCAMRLGAHALGMSKVEDDAKKTINALLQEAQEAERRPVEAPGQGVAWAS